MPVILIALALSESAVTAVEVKDYRLVEPQADSPASRRWTPGVDAWKRDGNDECPAFFEDKLDGLVIQVGPRCTEEEIPYAL
jgi:hypothetical protein